MSSPSFAVMKPVYSRMWASSQIIPSRLPAIQRAARLILSNKDRYEKVEKALGVPWYLVGCLHLREAGCNFHCHLHNGDPLSARTYHVPAGRPLTGSPPFTWEESATDALTMRGLDKVDWKTDTIERVGYEAEGYNGWGYAFKHRLSPYDFSGMDDPSRPGWQEAATGKYIRDHVFDPSVIDRQPGVLSVLKVMSELDPTILAHSGASRPVTSTNISSGVAADNRPQKPKQEPQASPPVRSSGPSATVGHGTYPQGLLGAILAVISAIFKVFS